MSSPTEVVGRTLTLYLPESLVAETGRQTLEALGEAVAGGELDRVRLDASALVTLYAAGMVPLSLRLRLRACSRNNIGGVIS
jgi:hypothetical protein